MEHHRWAERHDGLVTSEVLRRSGWSRGRIRRDRDNERLRRVRRGVMSINGTPRTWLQGLRAVLLSSGPDVSAAQWSAVRLLGGQAVATDTYDVLAPYGRQITLDGVRAHRSRCLEPGDVIVRNGMPCTSGLRTVIDLSGITADEQLGHIVDDLLRRRLLDLDELRSRVNRLHPGPGRSVARLRRILAARIVGFDPGESALEARISRVIVAEGLPHPVQQLRWSVEGRHYRFDFAWPERRVFVEGNGFGFHSMATDLDRDARRQNDLVADGWRPVVLTWRMTDAEIALNLHRFLD